MVRQRVEYQHLDRVGPSLYGRGDIELPGWRDAHADGLLVDPDLGSPRNGTQVKAKRMRLRFFRGQYNTRTIAHTPGVVI